MKRHQFLLVFLALVIVLLGACRDSTDKSNNVVDSKQAKYISTQDEEKGAIKEENNTLGNPSVSTDDTQSNAEDATINTAENSSDGVSSKFDSDKDEILVSKKKEYLQKLEDTKNKTEQLEAVDTSTYALKKVESDRWELWDDLLNEIYGVLEEQLPQDKMGILREEQLDWIKYRDDNALEASQKYKGGTQENLEYVSVLANITEERCYELVENYMK